MKDDRFQVFLTDNLSDRFRDFAGDGHWALCEVLNGKIIRMVGIDGGEPEDQTLVRDWQWVVNEMNQLRRLYDEAHKQAVAFARGSEELHRERLEVLEKLRTQRKVTFDLLNTGCPFHGHNEYTDATWCSIDKNIDECRCNATLELPRGCPLRDGTVTVKLEEKKDGGENEFDGP